MTASSHARAALRTALLLLATVTAHAHADDYGWMLGYLADTRLEGQALSGASGAIAINQAAGDLNRQANLRAIAAGELADTTVSSTQHSSADSYDVASSARARIGGDVLVGASGVASINQASGSGNAETNALTVRMAQRGIRETPDLVLSSGVSASAERQHPGRPAASTSRREVAVDPTALRGFEGVLQLNQIAGSGNQIGNGFALSVQPGP